MDENEGFIEKVIGPAIEIIIWIAKPVIYVMWSMFVTFILFIFICLQRSK